MLTIVGLGKNSPYLIMDLVQSVCSENSINYIEIYQFNGQDFELVAD